MRKVRTKQGAAAIYTIVFFCILVGIITISFVSVMVQDILSSSSYDLYQSAYDSAQAGVEDAKVVLLKYNACSINGTCDANIKKVETASDNCDIITDALGDEDRSHEEDKETLIKTISDSHNTDEALDMAYTCVQIAIDTNDYLGTLSTTSDLKLVPLRAKDADTTRSVTKVIIRWFSTTNYRSVQGRVNNSDLLHIPAVGNALTGQGKRTFAANPTAPPTIKVGLIQTNETFQLSEFDASNGNKTNRATMLLRPVESEGVNSISALDVANTARSGSIAYNGGDFTNYPFDIKCDKLTGVATDLSNAYGYACWTEINLPEPYRGGAINPNTRFLLVSAPYSDLETDFSVEMRDAGDKIVQFHNVQPRVDSTGRANDVFRRVEARIEMVDTNFPYPRYALSTFGDGSDEGNIFKNYWATNNCWYMSNGTAHTCDNYSPIR